MQNKAKHLAYESGVELADIWCIKIKCISFYTVRQMVVTLLAV